MNSAICHTAARGGGHVIVPAGVWHTAAIHLKNNIDLHIEEGAVLEFSTAPDAYLPVVPVVIEGIRCYNYSPLIYGSDLENVSVTGAGILDVLVEPGTLYFPESRICLESFYLPYLTSALMSDPESFPRLSELVTHLVKRLRKNQKRA